MNGAPREGSIIYSPNSPLVATWEDVAFKETFPDLPESSPVKYLNVLNFSMKYFGKRTCLNHAQHILYINDVSLTAAVTDCCCH